MNPGCRDVYDDADARYLVHCLCLPCDGVSDEPDPCRLLLVQKNHLPLHSESDEKGTNGGHDA